VPPAQIQELSFIKHKVGGGFIGPCILSSGRSVNIIQVKGVFGAVAREGFGEMVWGNEVGLREGLGGVILEEESILSAVSNHLQCYGKMVAFVIF
jgi:hypothetical protein